MYPSENEGTLILSLASLAVFWQAISYLNAWEVVSGSVSFCPFSFSLMPLMTPQQLTPPHCRTRPQGKRSDCHLPRCLGGRPHRGPRWNREGVGMGASQPLLRYPHGQTPLW